MTPQERLKAFSEELEILLSKYNVVPIVVAQQVDDFQLEDGSTVSGVRRRVEYAALPETTTT